VKKAVQFILLLVLGGLIPGRTLTAQTILFQSGVDFPYPYYQAGLVGQEGWESGVNYSSSAAQIVSYAAGQALEIFGPFVASGGLNSYNSDFIQPLSNYDPAGAGTPVVSVSADIWMNLGPTARQASWLYGFLILNDQNGNAYASIGVDKNGLVFGQNFGSPNQVVTSTNICTNTFHVLRADFNFTSRQVTFYMDASPLGSAPFNPASGNLLGSVALVLQSSNPIDSVFLLDNLSVTAGTAIPAGSCSLQIASAQPCLGGGVPGTPAVGDLYGLLVSFNDVGTPYQPFRIKFTVANVTWYSDYLTYITTGSGWWYYFDWWVNLDGPLPWNIVLDPDGVSGSTNRANMTASGTFTPTPPSTPLQLYDPVTVGGTEESTASFQPGSGTMADLWVVFGSPTSHGAQNIISVTAPANSTSIVTAPYGLPVLVVARTNAVAGTFQQSESFTAQLNSMRVNPTLLRTNTWAQLSALPTNITQWLAPDAVCQSTSPAISNFVQLYLPTNYQTTMTPYDTARALQKAVMRSLIYLEPPPYPDATNSLQAGLADCGGYAALLTAALRCAGIPARRISGFWQGDSWQNDAQWHIRAEYYLPNTGWLITDACVGNECDPTGTYSWDFSFVPDANDYFAIDVGDAHILPYDNFPSLQVPNFWYYCCATYLSYDSLAYLQPLSAVSVSNVAGGFFNLSLTNVPDEGTVFLQASTNLIAWSSIATNTNPAGNSLPYSFPATNQPGRFFRAVQIP
jgi:transglutaminase-like putative cysteine protease